MLNLKILVVESKSELALLIKNQLKNLGYEVVSTVGSGREAIQQINKAHPDLVLIDTSLEGEMDGIETSQQIQSQADIPIVYVTSHSDKDVMERAKSIQPFGYLIKPIQQEELRAIAEMAHYKCEYKRKINGLNKQLQHEIIERKKIEESLRKSEKKLKISEIRFRNLIEQSPLGIVIYSPEGKVLFSNEAVKKLHGMTDAEVAYVKKHYNILEDEQLKSIGAMPYIKKGFAGEVSSTPAIQYDPKKTKKIQPLQQKKPMWLQSTIYPVKDDLDNIKEVVLIHHEITEIKRATEELKNEKEFIEIALNALADTVFVFDPMTGKALRWNKSFNEVSGYTNEEISSLKAPDSYYSETDLDKAYKYVNSILNGYSGTVELKLITKEGRLIPTEYSGSIIKDEEGNSKYIISIGRDIRERIKNEKDKSILETQLWQAHKMEALGIMAGGIAHDFNNILSIIFGYTEIAMSETPEGNKIYEALSQVISAAFRAKDLVTQILSFSRRIESEKTPVNLYLIIKETLKLLRAVIPTTIEIKSEINPTTRPVNADSAQIHQILSNLTTNAVHAMDEKGVLTVKLSQVFLNEENLSLQPEMIPGQYVKLTVNDTGIGIPPEIKGRIFDPFFTTKDVGKGTGLGLSVVHGIVKSHNGFIKVDSEPGRGTTFEIYFPVSEKEEEDFVETIKSLPKGNERILFVDDEEQLVNMGKEILERQEYNVTTTSNSSKALEIFSSSPENFDLVITDQTMPQLSGLELIKQLLKIRADIPIILCTGYSSKISVDIQEEYGIRKILMKPYSRKELVLTVRKILDKKY